MKIKKKDVVEFIEKVNDFYQARHPEHGWAFWDIAACHTGNMAVYATTKKEQFKRYSLTWAEKNQWMGAKSTDKAEWKYSYGETDDHALSGDWQICFQTYIDPYHLDDQNDNSKISCAREVMEYQMSTPNNDYWWWANGLYMVMPVMTKLYLVTENDQYLGCN